MKTRNRVLRKGIVLTIVILFIGISAIPGIYGSDLRHSNLENAVESKNIKHNSAELILPFNQKNLHGFPSKSPDIAVANLGDDDVSVFLNNGSGGFNTRQDYPAGNGSAGIATGDFNKDRYLDLAITNNFADSVSILLNNGSAGFGNPRDHTVGNTPYGIVAGDFNKDKYIDLATANYNDDSVSILLNDGSGGFENHQDYSVGVEPWGIVAGDFNSDDNIDLAVTNTGDDDISLLLNNGSGGFTDRQDFSVGTGPYGIVAGDFDSDNNLDLVVTNTGTYDIGVLLNDGSGGFEESQGYPVGESPIGIFSGYINTDSDLDLAVTNAGDNDISVLMNDGEGRFFTRQDYTLGSAPLGIVSGDFNIDGDLDLAVTNAGDNDMSVLFNNGVGGFGIPQDYPVGNSPYGIAAGDFDTEIENIIPTVEIVYPGEGETVNGTIIVQGTADDTEGWIEFVEVKIDDEDWEVASGKEDWTYEWDSTQYSDGDHVIYARSNDNENYSEIDMVNVIVDNIDFPPDAPVIEGPLSGTIKTRYNYTFTSIDSDNDDIAEYIIDWGDGTQASLPGPFASGEPATGVYYWLKKGTYTIKAKAKDVNGNVGPEGSLVVTMPKTKVMEFTLILRFLQRFPNAFPLLRQLLGL